MPASSKGIAALLGPILVALALATLVNLGSLPALTAEISREPALIMISGILPTIVRVHIIGRETGRCSLRLSIGCRWSAALRECCFPSSRGARPLSLATHRC